MCNASGRHFLTELLREVRIDKVVPCASCPESACGDGVCHPSFQWLHSEIVIYQTELDRECERGINFCARFKSTELGCVCYSGVNSLTWIESVRFKCHFKKPGPGLPQRHIHHSPSNAPSTLCVAASWHLLQHMGSVASMIHPPHRCTLSIF